MRDGTKALNDMEDKIESLRHAHSGWTPNPGVRRGDLSLSVVPGLVLLVGL
jgi:hypothetical protein